MTTPLAPTPEEQQTATSVAEELFPRSHVEYPAESFIRQERTKRAAVTIASAIAAARATDQQRIESAKFDAMCAEGERIANRVFDELPLDANVSDGNESADPADHIVLCVRAALAERDERIAELERQLQEARELYEANHG